MSKIKSIIAKEIKDSRGNPTVEVELETEKGSFIASVASGASTGENEALELRDPDGKGVSLAIKNVNKVIAPKLKGKDVLNQKEIDGLMIELDGTENKSKLGANAILPVSAAVCRAGAASKKVPLYSYISELSAGHSYASESRSEVNVPRAMFNVLEGGAHVHSEKHLDIQEFMIVPQKKTMAENLVLCNKIFQNLQEIIEKSFGQVKMGDEGGFAPEISKTEQALFLLKNAIGKEDCKIALDCAASQFFKNDRYILEGQEFTDTGLLQFYEDLVKSFNVISIEDPFAEEDWNGWQLISNSKFQISNLMVVGDDLTTTNIKRIKEAHNKLACNGVILKLNQIGTVSETIEASNMAKSFGWKTIVSHRSGETMDDFIADMAVGLQADFLKAGSPAKPERMVKYSRLMEIEKELNKKK
ncbi:MAG: enolase [Candidatus Staskawiczbacteria bacterium]|nr:enolase [Candidatus Staskawiczbacteria bacterium]